MLFEELTCRVDVRNLSEMFEQGPLSDCWARGVKRTLWKDPSSGDAALFRLRRRARELLQDPQGGGQAVDSIILG